MVGAALLLCAIVLFCFEVRAISAFNGWWLDELYWSGRRNPSLSFSISFPPNTPRYEPTYVRSALFRTRRLNRGGAHRYYFSEYSFARGCIAFDQYSLWRRVGELGWALFAGAFFLLSGPVLRYTLEGRAYLSAMSATFVASWFCALAMQTPDRRPHAASFALVGLIAAMIHFYAALMCVCLGGRDGGNIAVHQEERPRCSRHDLGLFRLCGHDNISSARVRVDKQGEMGTGSFPCSRS